MQHPLTAEQEEQALSALLECFTAFDHNNDLHVRWLTERYNRATAGIYPYYPLCSSWPEARANLGIDPLGPNIMLYSSDRDGIAKAAFNAWVYYGDLRGGSRFQRFIAESVHSSFSKETCYMQHLTNKYIARHVRQKRARHASEVNAFINGIYWRYRSRNNANPSVPISAKGLYHHELEGAFCPLEEDGTPTLLQTCGYCGTKVASLVLHPKHMRSSEIYNGLYPESWKNYTKDWGTRTVCDNPLCQEIEQYSSRDKQQRRVAALVGEPLNAPSTATLEKVPEEYQPAMKAARYVDFVARIEQRMNRMSSASCS